MKDSKDELLADLLKSLYNEFLNYLQVTGKNRCITAITDGKLSIDFQIAIRDRNFSENFKVLSSLPSFNKVMEKTASIQGIPVKKVLESKNAIFINFFNELANYLNPPKYALSFDHRYCISNLTLDEERLSYVISNAACPNAYYEKKDKILIIFKNITSESDIEINENLKLVKLKTEDIDNRISGIYDSGKKWERVFSAFETNVEYIESNDVIPALSSLLRLYQKGDIKYQGIVQEAEHIIRGTIFVPYKIAYSTADYYENNPSVRDDAWQQYIISFERSLGFASFISENLQPIMKMPYSCKTYNMVSASPESLRIPLLFFVIESFFSDVNSELVYRISLYLTVLLKRDDDFRKEIQALYSIRSSIAHGDTSEADRKGVKMRNKNSDIMNITDYTETILIELWKVLLRMKWEPKDSGSTMSKLLLGTTKV